MPDILNFNPEELKIFCGKMQALESDMRVSCKTMHKHITDYSAKLTDKKSASLVKVFETYLTEMEALLDGDIDEIAKKQLKKVKKVEAAMELGGGKSR